MKTNVYICGNYHKLHNCVLNQLKIKQLKRYSK